MIYINYKSLVGSVFTAVLAVFSFAAAAQQTFTVTDSEPANVGGLSIGYTIRSTEVKQVGDKGNFSRYSVRFFVTNTTNQANIILYKQGWNVMNNVSDELVQFNCLNATGARLTTKSAIINAEPCNVLALVDDKDPGTNKTVQNKRFVQIGYWIKAGETISADAILICPLNELPNVQAIYLADKLQPSAMAGQGNFQPPPPSMPPPPPMQQPMSPQGFMQLRNVFNNAYINIETGFLRASPITDGWWSASWQFIAVPGTNYINIKNRWKGTYLSVAGGAVITDGNGQLQQAMWILEPTADGSVVRIKNAVTGGHLCIAGGKLSLSNNTNIDFSSTWALEPR